MTYRLKRVDGFDDEYADLLRSLHDEIFGDSAPQIEPDRGWWWIAWDGREVAGFCGLTPTYAHPHEVAYLKRAGVRLLHRGQGQQRHMVRVREMLARRTGFSQIITDTTDNIPSSNTLIKCGYRLYRPQEPWGFRNTLYWTKDL